MHIFQFTIIIDYPPITSPSSLTLIPSMIYLSLLFIITDTALPPEPSIPYDFIFPTLISFIGSGPS